MSTRRKPSGDTVYDLMLALDQLESLREEMTDLGAATAADLAGRDDPPVAEVLADLTALGLDSLAALESRIGELHRQLDALGDTTPDSRSV